MTSEGGNIVSNVVYSYLQVHMEVGPTNSCHHRYTYMYLQPVGGFFLLFGRIYVNCFINTFYCL